MTAKEYLHSITDNNNLIDKYNEGQCLQELIKSHQRLITEFNILKTDMMRLVKKETYYRTGFLETENKKLRNNIK